MFRYTFILIFAVGMMGYSLVAFAGNGSVNSVTECEVTVKCTCEGKLSGVSRVVSCPEAAPIDDDDELNEDGTWEVNCLSQDLGDDDDEPLCPEVPRCTFTNKFGCCHSWEKSGCFVTLPVEVDYQVVPLPSPAF